MKITPADAAKFDAEVYVYEHGTLVPLVAEIDLATRQFKQVLSEDAVLASGIGEGRVVGERTGTADAIVICRKHRVAPTTAPKELAGIFGIPLP